MKIKDILASVGLPNTAAGKKKFYEMYPDEDSYQMAMGGPVGSVLGGLGNPYGLLEQGGTPCFDCGGYMAEGGEDMPKYQGDLTGSQTTGNNIPGFDINTGVYSTTRGTPDLTSAQLESMGMTQDANTQQWKTPTGNYVGYKKAYPGNPFYKAPVNNITSPSPVKTFGTPAANTVVDTSFINPVQQVNTGNTFKSRPILGGKQQQGGTMTADLEGTYPMFDNGGGDLSMSDFRKYLSRVKKEGGASFPGEGEQEILAKRKGEFLQTLTDNYDNHVMNTMQEEGFFAAGGSQDNGMNALMNFLYQRGQGDGYTYMPYNQRGYGMRNKEFARYSKLPASTQFQGISKINYGLGARLIPGLRNIVGPKSIEFNTRNAYEDNMQMQPTDEASIRKMLKMGKQKKSSYGDGQGPYPETENVDSQTAGFQDSQDSSYYDVPALNDDVRASFMRDMGNPNSPIHMNQPNNITLNPTYEQFGPNPISKFAPLAEHAYGGDPKYYEGGPGVPAYGANRTGPALPKDQWMTDALNEDITLQSKGTPASTFQNYLNTDPEIQQRKIDDNLLRDPATNKPYQDNTFKIKKDPWGEQEAIGLNTIGQGLIAFNNAGQDQRNTINSRTNSTFGTSDSDQAGVDFRGDYSKNAGQLLGALRYDQMLPVKNTGQSFTNEPLVEFGGNPFLRDGGRTSPSSNFWTASQINKAAQAFEYSEPDIDVNHTLSAVDRENANLEAEGGETAIVDVKGIPTHFDIKGPRHTAGGVPLNLPEDSFIFSDTKKMMIKGGDVLKQFGMNPKKSGYTPADIAKKITGGKYDMNYYRGVLADKDSNPMHVKTAETMIANYNLKLAKLGLVQESMKGFPQGIPKIAEPWMTSMEINPADLLQPQGQQDQPDGDMTAEFGGGLPKAQDGTGYVEGKVTKTSRYEPFFGGPDWVKFDQPITMPDGDVLYELPLDEWNKFQNQGYLDVAGAPFSRGTFRDVDNNPWGGDFKPGDSPKSYRINTKQPGKSVNAPEELPVGYTYKEGNKTYQVIGNDRYEDGKPSYRVKETSDPDKNIGSYFSSYMGNKVVPASEIPGRNTFQAQKKAEFQAANVKLLKEKAAAAKKAEGIKKNTSNQGAITNLTTAHEALEDIGKATEAEIEYLKSKGHKFIANGKTY